jgi:hypothetical protein
VSEGREGKVGVEELEEGGSEGGRDSRTKDGSERNRT